MSSLLVIDQKPIFDEAMDACREACRSIDQLRAEIERFESRDRPAFERWLHATFGARLSDLRALVEAAGARERELGSLRKQHWDRFFDDVDCELHSEGGLGREGWRMSRPLDEEEDDEVEAAGGPFTRGSISRGAFDDEGPEDLEAESAAGEAFYSDRDEEWGSEWARQYEELLARGPDRTSGSGFRYRGRGAYEADDDRRHSRGSGPGTGTGAGAGAGAGPGRPGEPESTPKPSREELIAQAERARRARIKERYRVLVRKLHPDLNAEHGPQHKSLWTQVQQAYQANDLEKLDLLLALSDAFTGSLSEATSLHQLRRAGEEIRRLLAPLRRKLEAARQDRAWGFSALADREELKQLLDRELSREAAKLRQKLAKLSAEIARFARVAAARASATTSP